MEKASQDSDPLPADGRNKKEESGDPSYRTESEGTSASNTALKKKSSKKNSTKSAKLNNSAAEDKKETTQGKNAPSKGQFGQFQKVILSTVREKLNMMMSEVCQCQQRKAVLDFSDKEKLTHKILCMIAEKKIESVHISPEEATRFLGLLDELNCGEDHAVFRDYSVSKEDGSSPFSGEEANDQKSDNGPFSSF